MYQRTIPQKLILAVAVIGTLVLIASPSFAGMPSALPEDIKTYLRLGEEPKQRLQVLSFFTVIFLLSALAVMCLWNGLRREFQSLPKISYSRALMVTFGWGLLFCIVLVMISGARELMTPGAWKKNGATYQLQPGHSEKVSNLP